MYIRKLFYPLSVRSGMAENSGRSRVASHTEYARSRFRCFGCGERVSVDRHGAGSLCVSCDPEGA